MHIVYLAYDTGIDGMAPKRLIVATKDKKFAEKMGPPPYCKIETMTVYDGPADYDTNSPEKVLERTLAELHPHQIEILKQRGLRA